jgi:iron complex outermembrane receptor protein
MKKLLGTMAFAVLNLIAFAQTQKFAVTGKVVDERTSLLAGATVMLNNQTTIADKMENFLSASHQKGIYTLKVTCIGFKDHEEKVSIVKNELMVTVTLRSLAFFLAPLEVKSIRANAKAPFAKTNLGKEEIAKLNLGQDLPFILNQTPSVVVNADAGNGVGYTAIRIRGTDATRINVTLNGIPYNDAESQGTFFVDLPDFTSSVNSIQVQRGVGTSSNGTGAFGATINLSTNEFNEKAYGELNNSYGSFNTWKNTVKAGTGLIDGHFTVDARLSQVKSDGYIQRASSDMQSFYFSAAYLNKKSSLRLNVFSGKEKTYQAWNGVPEYLLNTDRTYNSSGTEKAGTPYDNETDNFRQTHYQLFFNTALSNTWDFNTAVFLTKGLGYYENFKGNAKYSSYGLPNVVVGTTTITRTDLIRQQWLDNNLYGQILSFQHKKVNNIFTIGGGWNSFDNEHYGNVIWAKNGGVNVDYKYYDQPAKKTDANIYAKLQQQLNNNLSFFADVQYRYVAHKMNGFRDNPTLIIDRKFNFVNPKLGLTYSKNNWQAFASYAMANKEPNRDDFEAGISTQPKKETLHDFELGIEKKTSNYSFGATVYYMLYKDQLVLTGKVNDVGAYTRTNVDNSYRAGIELQGSYVFAEWVNAAGNIAFSNNKIKSFTEYVDDYDNGGQIAILHNKTNIAFSPATVASIGLNFKPIKNAELSFLGKYVDKQFLDNAQSVGRMLADFYTQDIRASYTIKNKLFKEWNIIGQVNNVFNKKYEPNGYTFSYVAGGQFTTENFYFPMAGTNFMVALNIKL